MANENPCFKIKSLKNFKEPGKIKNFILSVLAEFGFKLDPRFDKDLDSLKKNYLKKGNKFWILIKNKELVGTIAIKKLTKNRAQLKRFYLLKKLRGRGLGKKMFKKILLFCENQGYETLYVDVASKMQQGVRFYLKNSFEIIKKEKGNIFLKRRV